MTKSIVVETKADVPSNWSGKQFIVDAEISSVDDATIYAVLWKLYCFNPDVNSNIPIYRIIWSHLAASAIGRGSLLNLIPLAIRLREHIQAEGVRTIYIGQTVDDPIVRVVEDVCSESACSVRYSAPAKMTKRAGEILSRITGIIRTAIPYMLTQLLSLLLPRPTVGDKSIMVFPYPGRLDSMLPLAHGLEGRAEWFGSGLGSSFYRPQKPEAEITLQRYQDFMTLSVFSESARALLELLRPSTRRSVAHAVTQHLTTEFEVSLPRTIRHSVDTVIDNDISALLTFIWADHFFASNDVSAVLVGGPHAREFAILEAAIRHDVQTYYVHHSVVTGAEFLPPTATTYFVPSQVGREHIERIYDDTELPTLQVSGRPYFTSRYDTASIDEATGDIGSGITLLIATQPFMDAAREQLLVAVFEASEKTPLVNEIRVKPHPDESAKYYQRLIAENAPDNTEVHMASDDLESAIADSSLVVTINSNVGLEAMIHGTPAVCYNSWYPLIQNKAYARTPEVPILKNTEELAEFFKTLTVKDISEMAAEQQQFSHQQFLQFDCPASDIADSITNQNDL